MFRFFSPFRWLWIIIGILLLATVVAGLGFFVYGLVLGHPVITFGRVLPFFWFGPFFGFIFILLLIGFGVRLFFRPWRRWGYYGRRGYYYGDPALQSLRVRYARGEITKEQFDAMASDLEKHRPS